MAIQKSQDRLLFSLTKEHEDFIVQATKGSGAGSQTLRTNIKQITRYVSRKIAEWRFDVYITLSHTSRSRYLEFTVGKWRSFIVRISDHPTVRYREYDYDVYTDRPRRGAIDYLTLINLIEKRLFKSKERKTG